MKNLPIYVLVLWLLASCSSERNTWTSKAYHNTTAHYNGYFYARDEIEKIEASIRKDQIDDYNRILRLFPTFDTAQAKRFDKEIQEAIKMASISIQRHPNSKWVDDAYILVGKARLYSMDWGNAIQTFKYTNKIGKDANARHVAILNLIRTYIEHGEFNNALAAMDYLQKEDLSKVNRKKLHLEKAYYYQLHRDYDNMVRNLAEASPMLKKKDHRGRIYFIIGQVYQELGFEAEAYNYYKKCLSTNPEYEVDFYARLYMAQVTEISRNKDIASARKSFNKLLRDLKNKEFKDKIYYEMGIFEQKQNNLNEAIDNFKLSVRHGTNKRIDGEAFLRLGEIYYDTLKDYPTSQAYYDSAIATLPQDYENYEQIKTRAEVLNEFVRHLKTIEWQDSLLTLSSLDSIALKAMVDTVVTRRLRAEEELKARTKKRSNRTEMSVRDQNVFATGEDDQAQDTGSDAGWYFDNPTALATGQNEFRRVWGNIALEDNWRRSQRQNTVAQIAPVDTEKPDNAATTDTESTETADPAAAEFAKLNAEIPRTEEQKAAALKQIEDGYFKLGEIYYFKLQENKEAVESYETLLQRFPESSHEPEALYTLYLILKDEDPAAAEEYAALLKRKHPTSTFAKILINPAYLQESSLAAEKQKVLYKTAYDHFENGELNLARDVIAQAESHGETLFSPYLQLLRILIVGETENIAQYQYQLDQFTKQNEGTEVGDYAKRLLESSRSFQLSQEKRKGIQYIRSFEEPHYFVIMHRKKDKMREAMFSALDAFNQELYPEHSLNISTLLFNEEYDITFVAELPNLRTAITYFLDFKEKQPTMTEFRNQKFDNFVITKDNFETFHRTKGLDEYLQFFEKNYPQENQ